MILHVLMGFLFFMGILLNILSFYAYSKLTTKCTYGNLKVNLRIAICIGSFFMASSLAFFICTGRCDCDINSKNWPIYVLLSFMLIIGIYLSVLTANIKSELEKCQEDIGSLPTILFWVSIIQIVAIVSGYGIYIYNKKKSDKKDDGKDDGKDDEKSDQFLTPEELKSDSDGANKELLRQIKQDINETNLDISRNKIELKKLTRVERGKRDEKWQKKYNEEKSKQTFLANKLKTTEEEYKRESGNSQSNQSSNIFGGFSSGAGELSSGAGEFNWGDF